MYMSSLVHTEAFSMGKRDGGLFEEQKTTQGLYSSSYIQAPIRMH